MPEHKCPARPCWHEGMMTPVCALVCMQKNSANPPGNTDTTTNKEGYLRLDNRRPPAAQVYQHELRAYPGAATGMNIAKCKERPTPDGYTSAGAS